MGQQLPEPRCPLPHYALPTANSSARRRALKSTSPPYSSGSTSSLSKLRSPPSKITPSYYPYVANINLERTARLWKAVMSKQGKQDEKELPQYLKPAQSSIRKIRGNEAPIGVSRGVAAPQPTAKSVRTTGSASTTTRTTKSAGTTSTRITGTQLTAAGTDAGIKPKTAKVTDKEFATEVLRPYGITIEFNGQSREYDHFGFMGLPDKSEDRVQAYKKKLPHVTVWVENVKEEDVQSQYNFMKHQRCNNAQYSRYALRIFFLEEQQHLTLGGERWVPYSTAELVWGPKGEWVTPPILDGMHPRPYDWDYRTDVTYWTPSEAFEPNYREIISTMTSEVHQRGFCPYLTIEFKRDGLKYEVAQCQVAVAAAMSLFNRYRLKCLTLEATGQQWSNEDKSQMRHYGITFMGSQWKVWCIRPKRTQGWDGCKMEAIYYNDCHTSVGVSRLIRFINDIHYWGLAVHGQSCMDDILALDKARVEARKQKEEEAIDVSVLESSSVLSLRTSQSSQLKS
ncbi:hypothetical protein GGR51DRAFT_511966 [Nemania sp. FL0031]|nr:hypothetical protein GGR51DRAFT_511966 [Nemania sp. FL0031]